MLTIAAVLAAAYVVAYPIFALTYYDVRRFPAQLWTGFGSPEPWRQAVIVSYACGGLPVVVTALAWRTSRTRAEMRAAAHRSGRRR